MVRELFFSDAFLLFLLQQFANLFSHSSGTFSFSKNIAWRHSSGTFSFSENIAWRHLNTKFSNAEKIVLFFCRICRSWESSRNSVAAVFEIFPWVFRYFGDRKVFFWHRLLSQAQGSGEVSFLAQTSRIFGRREKQQYVLKGAQFFRQLFILGRLLLFLKFLQKRFLSCSN